LQICEDGNRALHEMAQLGDSEACLMIWKYEKLGSFNAKIRPKDIRRMTILAEEGVD